MKLFKKKRFLASILIVFFISITLTIVFRHTVLSLAANGADYILRPVIGSTNTLKLESLVFGFEDKMNQLAGHSTTTTESIFSSEEVSSFDGKNLSGMTLEPIPHLTTLPAFQNEGSWQNIAVTQFPNDIVMAKTLIHVEQNRSYAFAALVKINMTKLAIGSVAGIKQPGGPIGNPGEGKVPAVIKDSGLLVAAFDGGFQYRDGAYGMIVNGKTYVPLQNGLATLFISNHGQATLHEYESEKISQDVIAVRQNGPLLLKDGKITSFTEKGKDTWGRTVTNSMYTWRSGIGVTKDGNLVYAVGPSLVPETLARALQSAGAVTAMQLDINPFWVRFVLFHVKTQGTYLSTSLLKNMENGGTSYLQGYQKDFFYLFSRMQ